MCSVSRMYVYCEWCVGVCVGGGGGEHIRLRVAKSTV